MNIEEYIKKSARTSHGQQYLWQLEPETIHGIIGIAAEAGELLSTLKATMYYDKMLDVVNIREELGDIMWFIAQVCRSLDVSLETILDENIKKLELRYPDHKFSTEDAVSRKDKDISMKSTKSYNINPIIRS